MRLFADAWMVTKAVGQVTLDTVEALVSILISPHKANWYCEAVSVPPLKDSLDEDEWSHKLEELRGQFEAAANPTEYAAKTATAVSYINAIGTKLFESSTGPGLPTSETIAFKLAAPILLHITERNHKPMYVALVALLMIDQRIQDSLPGGTFTDRMAKLLGKLAGKAGWTEEALEGSIDAGWAFITAEVIVLAALIVQLIRHGEWSVLYGLDLQDEPGSSPVNAAHDLLRRAVTLRLPLAPPPFDFHRFIAAPTKEKFEEAPPPPDTFTITTIPVPATATDPEKLFVQLGVSANFTADVGSGWQFRYSNAGQGGVLASHNRFETFGNAQLKAEIFQEGDIVGRPASAEIEPSEAGSAGLQVKSKRIGAGVQVDIAGPAAWLQVDQCEVRISGGHWLADHIPQLSFIFDAAVDASVANGVRFRGGVGGDVVITIGKKVPLAIGKLAVNSVRLQVAARSIDDHRELQLAATTDLTLSLFGLLDITTVGLGAAVSIGSNTQMQGNLAGVAHTEGLQLLTPTSAGLSIHRFGLEGAGILLYTEPTGTLFGGVALSYKSKFSFTGLGLYQTPSAARPANWLLALSMTTAASPGGFIPKGGGLLYASGRGTDPDAFLAAVQTGDLAPILAPDDPVGHAAQYQASLDRLFPVRPGSQVFGAIVKFEGFGGKLHFDIGALLEWANGDLVRFYLIASFSFIPLRRDAVDPKNRPVVVLADGVLVSDASTGELNVRIALRNSRLWSAELTGEAMVFYGAPERLGDSRAFFLSIGGFHPSYVPGPRLFVPKRLTLSLSKGDHLKLEMSAYLAVTPQSFQIGFRSALEAHLYGFGIRGSLDIDALVHFDFRIEIDIKISVELLLGSQTLAAVTFEGSLSVFVPTILAGSVKVKFLFWTLSKSGSLTIVDGTAERESVDVSGLVEAAIRDRANWNFGGTSGFVPTKHERDGGWHDGFASPVFRQTVVPFDVAIDRFAGVTFETSQTFHIEPITTGLEIAPVAEDFAIGQYLDLSDDEMLGGAMFEKWTAGFALKLPYDPAEASSVLLDCEELIRDPEAPRERHPHGPLDFAAIAGHFSRFSEVEPPPKPIQLHALEYAVLDNALAPREAGLNFAQARALALSGDRVFAELAA